MILVYNFLLTLLLVLLLPVIIPVAGGRKKYRGRSLARLGLSWGGLKKRLAAAARPATAQTIWIHALSVGEVTSALPLVKAIRADMGEAFIVFTTATRSGGELAESLIAPHADIVCAGPFDLWFSVGSYINFIRPDLFILVETDFWPNWLYRLHQKNIPTMLVNGRISKKSFAAYSRYAFFFMPMFRSFKLLSMQTADDAAKMFQLGIDHSKIASLGNLKYDMDTTAAATVTDRLSLGIGEQQKIWICGSTHPGEEKIILSAFARLAAEFDLVLVIAPRDIGRAAEIVELATSCHLTVRTRTGQQRESKVLVLNTIGELSSCYRLADLAFVGGSLVNEGGHNPIEPAAHGVPVLFGPHMDDFSEIARELLACGGAQTVTTADLLPTARAILAQRELQNNMGQAALSLVNTHRGGVARHLQAIRQLLRS